MNIPTGLAQALRSAASPSCHCPPLPATVRHERIVELAFEELHLSSIRRWKTAEHVMPGPIKGMTYVNDEVLTTVVNNSFVRAFNPERDYSTTGKYF